MDARVKDSKDLDDSFPINYEEFVKDADFLWSCILKTNAKESSNQETFMKALENCLSYLNGLKLEEIKAICLKDDMAEKISMIIDLKDYVYNSLIDEWKDSFTDL